MIILGIETSCDETALALIETRGSGADFEFHILGSLIHSQADLHSAYGGVFPNLAKREHGKNLVPLLDKLLIESNISQRGTADFPAFLAKIKSEIESSNPDLYESLMNASFLNSIPAIDRIAVTEGPGLEPTLWVGITFAEMLSKFWSVPVIPVNHMEGHVVASLVQSDKADGTWQRFRTLPLPALALLISGGHTELVTMNEPGHYEIVGETRDDAVGEAYDKVARLLGLPYPGGPQISKMADEAEKAGIVSSVTLPRPMISSRDLNFSFSGLKTAVLYAVRDHQPLTPDFVRGLALEFERAVCETLATKLHKALEQTGAQAIIVGGGVSANRRLRAAFQKLADEFGIPLFLPSTHLSGDNALMIALAGADAKHEPDRLVRAQGTKRLGMK